MNDRRVVQLPPQAFRALADYLQESGRPGHGCSNAGRNRRRTDFLDEHAMPPD
jgi:hypothetical protein